MSKRRGAKSTSLKIPRFRDRVEWIAKNLYEDPTYARWATTPEAIYAAYQNAVELRLFGAPDFGEPAKDRKWKAHDKSGWYRALRTDHVPRVFIDWLLALFPQLDEELLTSDSIEYFFQRGRSIEEVHDRWAPSIVAYSDQREALAQYALKFYLEAGFELHQATSGHSIPLLIQKGWIRDEPLELKDKTEVEANVTATAQAFSPYPPRRLDGLSGGFMIYRGKLGYGDRSIVRPEPQHNGEIFCAEEAVFDSRGFIGFRYRLGHYFDYINTSEILGVELSDSMLKDIKLSEKNLLKYRGKPSDAFNLSNRAAYPGVNCLTIIKNYGSNKFTIERGDWFLLHKRDKTQLQAQNTVHVVPAGGHQGLASGSDIDDTAIWRTHVREFAEELFNKEKLTRQLESWVSFSRHPEIIPIKQLFSEPNPAVHLFLLGCGLDPITLKPEILCVQIVDWDRVKQIKVDLELEFNWELQTADPSITRHHFSKLTRENLVRFATEKRLKLGDRELDPLPAGAACMLLTADHYDFLGL